MTNETTRPDAEVRSVLVAIDLSPESAQIFRWALRLCHAQGGRIVLAYVLDVGEHVWSALARSFSREGIEKEMLDRAGAELAQIHDAIESHGLVVERRVLMGRPADQILACADAENVDLIVVGSHGRGPVAEFVLGGVADKVVRRAHRPVCVLPVGRGSRVQ